ncbi:MAG: efflux RND transporter periplasmic adaptor subunit [Planctomycetes bacterium]|nr:efflux RND transporter periplasmic adaptor subunit [Planctomycetota bacterium]MBI3848617.1 efflux RND transporter periplasmic adaptor subunit [Planctomycetota bacterium]
MKKPAWVALGVGTVGLAVLLSAGLPGATSGSKVDDTALFTTKKGPLSITLTETGTLKTKKSIQIRPEIEGGVKISSVIEEGSEVKEGDVVVELDKTEAKKRIEDLENQVIDGESALKTANTDFEIQEAQNKTDAQKAELRGEVARVNWRKLIEGDIPKESSTRKLRVSKAYTALKRSRDKAKDMPQLLELGFMTKSQVDEENLKVDENQIEYDSAKQDLRLYKNYQEPLEVQQREAEVSEAEQELIHTKQRAESSRDQKQGVVRKCELNLKNTKDRLEEEKKKFEKLTLKAPKPGIVIYGDIENRWMSREVKVGNQVWPNQTIITIPDNEELSVVIKVHEADINKLKVGQPATITLETYKGLLLQGEITKIGSVANANNDWGESDVKKFTVDVGIKGKDLNLRPGITAKVEVALGEMKDVLYVPIQAVNVKDGKYRCFVRSGGRVTAREVDIGQSNDHFVEVKKGLDEGDCVLLYNPEGNEVEAAPTPSGQSAPASAPSPATP